MVWEMGRSIAFTASCRRALPAASLWPAIEPSWEQAAVRRPVSVARTARSSPCLLRFLSYRRNHYPATAASLGGGTAPIPDIPEGTAGVRLTRAGRAVDDPPGSE